MKHPHTSGMVEGSEDSGSLTMKRDREDSGKGTVRNIRWSSSPPKDKGKAKEDNQGRGSPSQKTRDKEDSSKRSSSPIKDKGKEKEDHSSSLKETREKEKEDVHLKASSRSYTPRSLSHRSTTPKSIRPPTPPADIPDIQKENSNEEEEEEVPLKLSIRHNPVEKDRDNRSLTHRDSIRENNQDQERDDHQLKIGGYRSTRILRSVTLSSPTEAEPIKEINNEKEKAKTKAVIKREKDEEVISLKRMSAEEREMIKGLIKMTKKKNKALERIDDVHKKETEGLQVQWELEKSVLEMQIASLQSQLTLKSHEVQQETSRNQDLRNELQQTQLELQATQASLVNLKQTMKKYKKQCELELNKKSQSIMEMTLQLGKLHQLRDSMDCVICEEKVAKVILEPCCHMVMCRNCSNNMKKCPMCRADIVSKLEVYYNWIV